MTENKFKSFFKNLWTNTKYSLTHITKDKVIRFILNNKALLILIVLLIIVSIVKGDLFFTSFNLGSVIRSVMVMMLLGLSFTIVLAVGGVDLSAGNMLSFLGMIYALMSFKMPLPLAFILTVVIGGACGFANGFISEFFKLPPFIVTLAMAQVYLGLAYISNGGQNVSGMSDALIAIGSGSITDLIPYSLFIVLAVGIAIYVTLFRTKYGRHLLATGGNSKAALLAGVNTKFAKISTYVILGMGVSLAAIVLTGRLSIATPIMGSGMEMDAIAAVVIGGTSMAGGKAKVGGTVFGCLVIGIITNMLNLMNIDTFWQYVAKGIIIILAITLDVVTEKIFSNMRKSETNRLTKSVTCESVKENEAK